MSKSDTFEKVYRILREKNSITNISKRPKFALKMSQWQKKGKLHWHISSDFEYFMRNAESIYVIQVSLKFQLI